MILVSPGLSCQILPMLTLLRMAFKEGYIPRVQAMR